MQARRVAFFVALFAALPAAAQTDLAQAKFDNLGLFAGYVVACGVAGEADADAMVKKLGAGLGETWTREETAIFDAARATARKTKCNSELRAAVERGWLNYLDAK